MYTILVVDDDPYVNLSIERSLRAKYQVRVSDSGSEALKLARRIKPNMFILDVRMPGMSGIELCRELRSDPSLADIPILFLTAQARIEDKIAGFEAGADDYLTKPFEIRELLFRVQAILRRSGQQNEEPIQQENLVLGSLHLNCQNFQLQTAEKEVLLTPVEFDLMYHLMSHPNQIFSGERLLRELWDYPSDTGSTDLVRMHIRNIRRKIEPDTKTPRYILTIARHGYTISTD